MKWRIVVDEVNRGSQSPKLVARSCRMYDDIFYIYLIPSEEKAGFSEGRILQYADIYICSNDSTIPSSKKSNNLFE